MKSLEKFSLRYEDDVPKDYDVSKMQFTFDFVYLVLERGASIDGALRGVANEYRLSESCLMDYFVENKYVLNRTDADELSRLLKSYNTKSLKKILKSHGLKASGKRERIEERIIENNLLGNEYYLSSKSKVFYKNKKRRFRIYNEYLCEHYYFDEFNEFYMDNYRKKEAKIPIGFINLHIDKSIDDESHESYSSNTRIMAEHFLKRENYRNMLEYVLREYCMNLNPIWKVNDLDGHTGISVDTYDSLKFLQEKLSKNTIISDYFLVWDSFDFERIIVSKYDGYRCLKDILNFKDFDKINKDLDRRFYSNENLKIKRITQKTLFDF